MALGGDERDYLLGGISLAENYLVLGEEEYLVQARVWELAKEHAGADDWGRERLSGWEEARAKLLDAPMFSGPRVFLLDYQALAAAKPDPGRVTELLASHENVLILYCRGKADRRTSLFKGVAKEAKLIDLVPPRGYALTRWVETRAKELGAARIDKRAAEKLVYLAGTNMLALENELNKLVAYCPVITEETVDKLAASSLQTNIFALVDSAAGGQAAKALVLAERMLRSGEGAAYILYMLGRQYRLLFRFLFYREQQKEIAEIQKILPTMHPYAFQNLGAQGAKLSLKHCAFALQAIQEADWELKTGRLAGAALLQKLLVKIAKK